MTKKLINIFITILLLAGVVFACGRKEEEKGGTGVNVLLISIDTLRPDHLGCYGVQERYQP